MIGTHSVHYTARVVLAAATAQILQRCPNQSCKRLVKVLWCGGSSYTLVVAKSCLLLLGWYFDNVQRPPFTRTTIRPSADFIRSFGTTFMFRYPSIMEYALGQDSFVVMYNVMPKNENVLVLCLNSNVKPGKRPNQTTSKWMPLFIASRYHYHYHLIFGMKIDVAKSNFLATLPF